MLKESLIKPLALEHLNYQLPFFLLEYRKEGNAFGILNQNYGDYHQPIGSRNN